MEDYGHKYEYNPQFKGPLRKRSCTDVIFLVIFIVFVVIWSYVGYYAIRKGDLENIIYPTNSEERKCGIDPDVRNMSYLMFFNLNECLSLTLCSVQTVCREKCPDENFIYIPDENLNSLEETVKKLICKFEVDLSKITSWKKLNELIENKKCAKWYLKSVPVLKRCLPIDAWVEFENMTMTKQNLDRAKYVIQFLAEIERTIKLTLSDIKTSWCAIISMIAASGLMAVIHIMLLRCLALPFVYACILIICLSLSYGIYETNLAYSEFQSSASLTGLIACSVILSIVVLVTIFLRKRIYLACQIIKETSIAVTSTMASLIFPIFPWAVQLSLIVFSIAVALFLTSVSVTAFQIEVKTPGKCVCPGYLNYNNQSECDPGIFIEHCKESGSNCVSTICRLTKNEKPWFINYMHVINAVGAFWLFFFVSALNQMIMASTFATWYWTFRKDDVPFFVITESIWRTFRYHLGTLALGSLVITICNVIRIILSWLRKKVKNYGNNQVAQQAITCCKCFFWMLDRFLKYMNHNAYIECAIHGKSFCTSARNAFNLIMRNIVRVFVLNKITEWLLLLGKLYITCIATFIAWLFYEKYQIQPVQLWIGPVALVAIGSFLITSLFFSVYSSAIDTLFLCFLEDCERNDGSEARPYYMSRRLRKLLNR